MTFSTKGNPVKPEEVKNIVDSLVLAFSADPIVRWIYPSARQYLSNFPNFVAAFGKSAFDSHTVYYPDNYAGAALWFPPHVEPDGDLLMETIRQTLSTERQTEVFGLLEQISNFHPSQPHWYLGMLGVDPAQQNRGYASASIQGILDLCDRSELPAYLESSNSTNIAFYKKHGFKVIGEIQAHSSPTMFSMIRHPRNTQETLLI